MFSKNIWRTVSEKLLTDSILLHLVHQGEDIPFEELSTGKNENIIFIGEISRSIPDYEEIIQAAHMVKYRMFIGGESPGDLNTYTKEQILTIKEYLKKTCGDNFYNGMKCLAAFRGRAVIIDHLTPVYLPVSLDEDMM